MPELCYHIDSRVDTLVVYKLLEIHVTVEATSSDLALGGLPHPPSDRSARTPATDVATAAAETAMSC